MLNDETNGVPNGLTDGVLLIKLFMRQILFFHADPRPAVKPPTESAPIALPPAKGPSWCDEFVDFHCGPASCTRGPHL